MSRYTRHVLHRQCRTGHSSFSLALSYSSFMRFLCNLLHLYRIRHPSLPHPPFHSPLLSSSLIPLHPPLTPLSLIPLSLPPFLFLIPPSPIPSSLPPSSPYASFPHPSLPSSSPLYRPYRTAPSVRRSYCYILRSSGGESTALALISR